MYKIYDLQQDSQRIAHMQRASQADGPVGLENTHGLIGTKEWWDSIQHGALKVHRAEGVVSGFWPGQGGGGPAEFELREPSGSTSRWLCEVEPKAAERAFRLGRAVAVEYVLQRLKREFNGSRDSEVTVSISSNEA